MPDSVCELIEGIVSELGVARGNVVTVGSSMGAWAALYFGARIGARHTIVAEPQVLLGSYLDMPELHPIAAHIAGGTSPDDIDYLDAILFDALRAAESLPQVHILCGRTSPYMERHVQPLVALLDELGCSYQVTLGRNSKHSHVPVEFAWFLRTRLGEITSARESEVGSHP